MNHVCNRLNSILVWFGGDCRAVNDLMMRLSACADKQLRFVLSGNLQSDTDESHTISDLTYKLKVSTNNLLFKTKELQEAKHALGELERNSMNTKQKYSDEVTSLKGTSEVVHALCSDKTSFMNDPLADGRDCDGDQETSNRRDDFIDGDFHETPCLKIESSHFHGTEANVRFEDVYEVDMPWYGENSMKPPLFAAETKQMHLSISNPSQGRQNPMKMVPRRSTLVEPDQHATSIKSDREINGAPQFHGRVSKDDACDQIYISEEKDETISDHDKMHCSYPFRHALPKNPDNLSNG
jgi:hypothetical protein